MSISSSRQDNEDCPSDLSLRAKAKLTGMLNVDEIKHDNDYRYRIQKELLEVEKNIRRNRRAQSSLHRESVHIVAEHIKSRMKSNS
jgi:hypothetical protein